MNNTSTLFKIALLLIVAFSSQAHPQQKLAAVGAKTGFAFPAHDIRQTIAFGIDSDWRLSIPDTKLIVSLLYWESRYNATTAKPKLYTFGVNVSLVNELYINNYSITPYYGGGAGIQFNEYNEQSHYQQDTDIALNTLVGAKMMLSESTLGFAEAKYIFAGHIDYFAMWIGIKYIFL